MKKNILQDEVIRIATAICKKLNLTYDEKGSINFYKLRNKDAYHLYFRSINVKGSKVLMEVFENKHNSKKAEVAKDFTLVKTAKELGADLQIVGGAGSWGISVNIFPKKVN